MLVYFTDTHMFGRDFISDFSFKRKDYKTLREFIEQNGLDYNTLKKGIKKRVDSNTLLSDYLYTDEFQNATFYHISQNAMQKLMKIKGYTISDSDICENNTLGEIYTSILNSYCAKNEKKTNRHMTKNLIVNSSRDLWDRVLKSSYANYI